MKNIVKPTLVLTLIAAVVAGLLAATYNLAGIGELGKGLSDSQLKEFQPVVMPNATKLSAASTGYENEMLLGVYKDESSNCIALHFIADGYGGKDTIKMLVGFDENGIISGSVVIENAETPGLGSKVVDPAYLQNFVGRDKGSIAVGKNGEGDIDVIAGATVSSNAIGSAFSRAYELYASVKGDVE